MALLAGNDAYAVMFTKFFKNSSKMASTYKPVFLKALLDIGDLADKEKEDSIIGREWLTVKDGRLFVDLNFIAIRFAKYYWDMEYSFKLKQSQDRADANITRIVKNWHDPDRKPPTIRALADDRMKDFRAEVIRRSIKREVLVHLRTDMEDLYRKEDANTISLDQSVIQYMGRNKTSIKYGLNYVMSRYLEKINCNTPNIASKVDYDPHRVHRPTIARDAVVSMRGWQDSLCFYCARQLDGPHVDHVIPFNFVFSTDLYNCVLACQQCNCTKSDTLPERELFDRVILRNQERSSYLEAQTVPYNEESYCRLFDVCISEYNGSTFFRPE